MPNKNNKKSIHFSNLCFLFIVLLLPVGYAGDPSDETLEDELAYLKSETFEIYVEAATKTKIALSKAPGAVSVVTLDQIRKSNAKTIPEILRLVAGVHVRWNPMMQTITMRGYGQNPFTSRVLLLIDGIPYNSWNKGGFPQQPGFDFFPLENVKQLEVIRGPGSALYGENAHWGVINIATLDGEDIDGVRATYQMGSRETNITTLQFGKQFTEDFSILLTGKYLRSQFPISFWLDDVNEPNVRGTDFFAKARYKNLTFSYYRHDDKVDGYTDPIEAAGLPPKSEFKSAEEIKQTVEIYALNYKQDFFEGDYSFSGDLSYAERDGAHCGTCHATPEDEDFDGRKEKHGFQAIGDFRLGIHSLPHNDILLGVEVRREDAAEHEDELFDGDDLHGDSVTNYMKTAFYAQDIVSLFDDRLNITFGGRYDLETNPKLFGSTFSPRVAMVFEATDEMTLRASWGKAFRTPSFSELYQDSWFINIKSDVADIAFPLAVFAPNSHLNPEQIETFEFGLEYRFNSFFTSKLNLYHSTVSDSIVIAIRHPDTPGPELVISENHPNDAFIMGGELELLFNFSEKIHAFANWSFKHMEQGGDGVDSAGNAIEFVYAPKHQLNIGSYFGPFYGISGSAEYSWQSEYLAPKFYYDLKGIPVEPLSDYGYLNFRLNYQPPFSVYNVKNPLMFTLYLKNLLNNRPQETLVGVDNKAVGREIFFGVELQF